jgi:hypothetical protein
MPKVKDRVLNLFREIDEALGKKEIENKFQVIR